MMAPKQKKKRIEHNHHKMTMNKHKRNKKSHEMATDEQTNSKERVSNLRTKNEHMSQT